MTPADLEVFTAQLILLLELLGGPPFTEGKLALYCEAVRDLPLEALLRAIRAAAQTATFFPKPAELRALALGDTADAVENAWLLFQKAMRECGAYASVATADPALGATVEALFGSWPQACAADLSPEMWTARRKEFGRVYRVFAQRGLVGSRYLPGLVEQQNGGRPAWGKYTTLAVIGTTGIERLQGERAEQYRAALAARPPDGRSGDVIDIRPLVETSIEPGAIVDERVRSDQHRHGDERR